MGVDVPPGYGAEAKRADRLHQDLDRLDKAHANLAQHIDELRGRLDPLSIQRPTEAEVLSAIPNDQAEPASPVRRRLGDATREVERYTRQIRGILDHLDL